jgi:hypothetical protein
MMKNIFNHSSITILTMGWLFLLATIIVPQTEAAKSRAEKVGGSWGSNCWKEALDAAGKEGINDKYCSANFVCRNCCQRKKDNCTRKYPSSAGKCENYFTYCADVENPTKTLLPGGTTLPQAPSGKVQQTPPRSPFASQFNIQQFMQRFSLRSRGIETLPPPVIPDPIPPTLPNFELEKKKP